MLPRNPMKDTTITETLSVAELKTRLLDDNHLYFFRKSDPPIELDDLRHYGDRYEFSVHVREASKVRAEEVQGGNLLCPDGMVRKIERVTALTIVQTDISTEVYKARDEVILVK